MEPLYDLNLQLLEDAHVTGTWRVLARYAGTASAPAELTAAEYLCFEAPGRLILRTVDGALLQCPTTGECLPGTWLVQRDPLLSRPYLQLAMPSGATQALITRLRRSADGSSCEMILYFLNGTEIHLRCVPDLDAAPASAPDRL